jgi:L-asparaginase II
MALHAKAAGWDVETYWHPDHPVQRLALETIASLAQLSPAEIGTATDGCGVVTFSLPLRNAALLYVRLADPTRVPDAALRSALERIRDAMMAHPELVAGERRRLDTALMRAAPGRLVAKGGAEGFSSLGVLPDAAKARSKALGLVVKIEDGDAARRAGSVTVCALLRQLGILDEAALAGLAEYASPPIRDPRSERAGEVKATFKIA